MKTNEVLALTNPTCVAKEYLDEVEVAHAFASDRIDVRELKR